MNKDRILKIYSDLDRFFFDLKEIKSDEKMELVDFYASSMLLFSILQRTIDLGEELILELNLNLPDSHRDVFETLAKAKIITKEENEKLKNMVSFRNLIAHQYYEFEKKDIVKICKDLNVITNFVEKSKKQFKKVLK